MYDHTQIIAAGKAQLLQVVDSHYHKLSDMRRSTLPRIDVDRPATAFSAGVNLFHLLGTSYFSFDITSNITKVYSNIVRKTAKY